MVVVDVKKGPVDALNVCALISFFLFFFFISPSCVPSMCLLFKWR